MVMPRKLYLYNTLSAAKAEFAPITPDRVGVYVCGPTVYDSPHLGNARANVVFDILFRVLRWVYGANEVCYVRNITDVDDKIIDRAAERNITICQLTEEVTKEFHYIMEELGCLPPTIEPRATEHLDEMIAMIEKLLERDIAYKVNGHVYYAVEKFADYGRLTNRTLEQLLPGARIEVEEGKRSPYDFVLWKPASSSDDTASFGSPFGLGRPGWHIECSAMATKYLGTDFDIHGGGADLKFPHHTNEIAQSCGCYPESKYANVWVHNGFVTVNGEKMSKSLGNFITPADLLAKKAPGEAIRLVLLSAHYRKPLDWHDSALEQAIKTLDSFYRALEGVDQKHSMLELDEDFSTSLLDDLNTPKAIAHLHFLASEINKKNEANKQVLQQRLLACGRFLGLFNCSSELWFTQQRNNAKLEISVAEIETLIAERAQAKTSKNWARADEIRAQLLSCGVMLEDVAGGETKWRLC